MCESAACRSAGHSVPGTNTSPFAGQLSASPQRRSSFCDNDMGHEKETGKEREEETGRWGGSAVAVQGGRHL